MQKGLIIGATGNLGRVVTQTLLGRTTAHLTLFARHVDRWQVVEKDRVTLVKGDVLDAAQLSQAVVGQDFVFVALRGDLPAYVQAILSAMQKAGVTRVIFIAAMGIYNEVADDAAANLQQNVALAPYRAAADLIERAPGVTYTIIRPGWFTQGPVAYELTRKGEAVGGHQVSLASVADLVRRLVTEPKFGHNANFGIHTPLIKR